LCFFQIVYRGGHGFGSGGGSRRVNGRGGRYRPRYRIARESSIGHPAPAHTKRYDRNVSDDQKLQPPIQFQQKLRFLSQVCWRFIELMYRICRENTKNRKLSRRQSRILSLRWSSLVRDGRSFSSEMAEVSPPVKPNRFALADLRQIRQQITAL
jgi:hypothetical protein